MRNADSYRVNRRNAVRDLLNIRVWKRGPWHAIVQNPAKRRRQTIIHSTLQGVRV